MPTFQQIERELNFTTARFICLIIVIVGKNATFVWLPQIPSWTTARIWCGVITVALPLTAIAVLWIVTLVHHHQRKPQSA